VVQSGLEVQPDLLYLLSLEPHEDLEGQQPQVHQVILDFLLVQMLQLIHPFQGFLEVQVDPVVLGLHSLPSSWVHLVVLLEDLEAQ
jgi:hypothetical protein